MAIIFWITGRGSLNLFRDADRADRFLVDGVHSRER